MSYIMSYAYNRFPGYYTIKTLFLLWLMLPQTRGAILVYDRILHPLLLRHEDVLDEKLVRMKKVAVAYAIFLKRKTATIAKRVRKLFKLFFSFLISFLRLFLKFTMDPLRNYWIMPWNLHLFHPVTNQVHHDRNKYLTVLSHYLLRILHTKKQNVKTSTYFFLCRLLFFCLSCL